MGHRVDGADHMMGNWLAAVALLAFAMALVALVLILT